jgi:hypothetical protein
MFFTGWDLYHGAHFNAQEYLAGGGVFLGGLGVYLFTDKSPVPETKVEKKEAKDAATGTTIDK